MNKNKDDILEISEISFEILSILLTDQTFSKYNNKTEYIIWATDDYSSLGVGYKRNDEIAPERIMNKGKIIIEPRFFKEKNSKENRTKLKAEVFTPSWVCREQNNLIDYKNYVKEGSFEDSEKKIVFKDGMDWKGYVALKRLEITCGEAPYIVSRYDSTNGTIIPLKERCGILDRKMRVITENISSFEDFSFYAEKAFQSVYAYEYQGDSLFISRVNMFYTFLDNYNEIFKTNPPLTFQMKIATIISWNIFQMDAFTSTRPGGKHSFDAPSLFGDDECVSYPFCIVKDWDTNREDHFDPFIMEAL